MIFLLLITIHALIYYFQRKKSITIIYNKHFYNYNLIWISLLGWTIIGFFKNLDFTEQWGCIVFEEPVFRKMNIIFSSISVILLISVILFRNRNIKFYIHLTETFYWIGKLFLFKGGYATGLVGTPIEINVLYDFVAIFLRLLAIRNLKFQTRTIKVSTIALSIIFLKMSFFNAPIRIDSDLQDLREPTNPVTAKMQGNWAGEKISYKQVKDTILPIPLDSTRVITIMDRIKARDTVIRDKTLVETTKININIKFNIVRFETESKVLKYIFEEINKYENRLYAILPDSVTCDSALMKKCRTSYRIRQSDEDNTHIDIEKIEEDSMILRFPRWGDVYRLKRENKKI